MIEIHQIAFDEGAVQMAYTIFPEDVRVGGAVQVMHQAVIDLRHPDYAEDGDLLMAQAKRMLRNALEDWEDSQPVQPEKDDEDDEGLGMGHGDKS